MKNLYARLVLFLIRPAVQCALREESKQGGVALPNRAVVANVLWKSALGARIDTLVSVTPPGGRL
ncbi:hypothetical protein B0G62_102153 [Paraburkholderia eburnea]|uniref:Uncharacterized protein n=1 Tax=Paraburkholderia eburnea TaxID=1189126 RepID=A0A2S4MIU0_9BURK|nr:hypothetical protein [Paraburkholderia eburnea]POR54545.1 hypothetical protein B0G62_102153 [Paraburkholderia eburnea]PRZ19760.1 hypothetical protein BX588_114153 [Paraburkholderia eburnea]